MTTQPTGAAELPEALALRLATRIEQSGQFTNLWELDEAAACLRRLHAQVEALSAAQAGVPASLAGPMQFGGCPECGSRTCVARECSRTVSHKAQPIPGVQWQCGQQASGFTSQPQAPAANHADIAARLRIACRGVRTKSYALADLIPLMQQAADALQSVSQPATADAVDAVDAARWRMLPAFFYEYQIDAMKLYRDIDAALAAQREAKP